MTHSPRRTTRPSGTGWRSNPSAPRPGPTTRRSSPRSCRAQSSFVRSAADSSRRSAGHLADEQVIAANVDVAFIVAGLDNDFNLRRLERYLAVAWASGVNPVVVLNKADIADDLEGRLVAVAAIAPGVPDRRPQRPDRRPRRGPRPSTCTPDGRRSCSARRASASPPWSTPSSARSARRPPRSATTTRAAATRRPTASCSCCRVAPCSSTRPASARWRSPARTRASRRRSTTSTRWPPPAASGDCRHDGEPGCAVRGALDDGSLTRRPTGEPSQAGARARLRRAQGRPASPGRGAQALEGHPQVRRQAHGRQVRRHGVAMSTGLDDAIEVPDPPAIPGLRFRHMHAPEDYVGMAAANQRARDAAGIEEVITAESMARDYAHHVNCDPVDDILVVERDGVIAGYGRTEWRDLEDGTRSFKVMGVLAPEHVADRRLSLDARLGRGASHRQGPRDPRRRAAAVAAAGLHVRRRARPHRPARVDRLDPQRLGLRDGPSDPRRHPRRADAGRTACPPGLPGSRRPTCRLGRRLGGVRRRARRVLADRGGLAGVASRIRTTIRPSRSSPTTATRSPVASRAASIRPRTPTTVGSAASSPASGRAGRGVVAAWPGRSSPAASSGSATTA